MTHLEYIREIVNSENAEDKIADLLVDELDCDMFIFDEYICKICPYHEQPECPYSCPYSNKEEIKMWLKADK